MEYWRGYSQWKGLDDNLLPLAEHHGDSKSKSEEGGEEEAPILPFGDIFIF